MEKKQLLLITKNTDLGSRTQQEGGQFYETTVISNIHAAYPLALNYLPDVILFDYSSLGLESLKNLENYKNCHFLNKSLLFLLGDKENKKVLEKNFRDLVDGIICDSVCPKFILSEVEKILEQKKSLTNYWKDSFMGLFNLLRNPVILLEEDRIVAMNDAFKNDFFITRNRDLYLSEFVQDHNKDRVKQTLRKFLKGKHMKAMTRTNLIMNEKLREAKITFSKLDRRLKGQLIMMINFTGKESPLNLNIGSTSAEIENYFSENLDSADQAFTKREKEIISLLCKGYKTKEISELLCISTKTIEKHRANIVKRTHSGTLLESIVYALNNNMIEV